MDSNNFATKCINAIVRFFSRLFRSFKNLFNSTDYELVDIHDDVASQENVVLFISPVYEKMISMISEEESTIAGEKGRSKKGRIGSSSKERRPFHRLFEKKKGLEVHATTDVYEENPEESLSF